MVVARDRVAGQSASSAAAYCKPIGAHGHAVVGSTAGWVDVAHSPVVRPLVVATKCGVQYPDELMVGGGDHGRYGTWDGTW